MPILQWLLENVACVHCTHFKYALCAYFQLVHSLLYIAHDSLLTIIHYDDCGSSCGHRMTGAGSQH